jgi:hypothetical protein
LFRFSIEIISGTSFPSSFSLMEKKYKYKYTKIYYIYPGFVVDSYSCVPASNKAVLRIRDVYSGSQIRIFPTRSRIPDPHPKNVSQLSADPDIFMHQKNNSDLYFFFNRMSSLPAHLQAGVKAQGDLRVGVSQFLVVTGSRRSGEKKQKNFVSNSSRKNKKKLDLEFICRFKNRQLRN